MAQEIESKILDIDIAEIEGKLNALGAKRIGEKLFRQMTFDYPGFPLDKEVAWVRLRDEGDKITLAYKKRLGVKKDGAVGSDSGMEEVEVIVSPYADTSEFLQKIGMVIKFSQEKKRISYIKDEVHYDIDINPKLNPYLEVEGPSWEAVDAAILALGFSLEDKKLCSTTQIYEMNGIRDKDYIKMTFDEFVKREA